MKRYFVAVSRNPTSCLENGPDGLGPYEIRRNGTPTFSLREALLDAQHLWEMQPEGEPGFFVEIGLVKHHLPSQIGTFDTARPKRHSKEEREINSEAARIWRLVK